MATVTQETWNRLRSVARRYVGSDLAQDVVQRVLLRLGTFEPLPLYFTAVRNEAISVRRNEHLRKHREAQGAYHALGESPQIPVMCEIPEKTGEEMLDTFVAVYREGLTLEEAGELLGVPMGTVNSRLHRLRALVSENTA